MKRKAILCICMIVVFFLPACDGSSSSNQTTTPVGDSPAGLVTNFIGQALEGWGQSQFLQAIGLQPAAPTEEQFEQMESDLSELNSKINEAIEDEQKILCDLQALEDYLKQQTLEDLVDSLNNLENLGGSLYDEFVSAVQDGTGGPFFSLSDIAKSDKIMSDIASGIGCTGGGPLQEWSCEDPINLIANDIKYIIGTNTGSGAIINVSDFASQLFSHIQQFSLEGFPTAGTETSGYDLPHQITANNETIMAYMSQMATLVQQGNNILSTLLYLKYYAPKTAGWDAISIPVDGYNDNNTYNQNVTALNTFFSDAADAMHKSAVDSLLSDNPGDPSKPGIYKNVKTLTGVSGGTWTAGCNLYVWSGATTDGTQAFTDGIFDGGNLAAQCTYNGQTTTTPTLALTTRCYDAGTDEPVMTQTKIPYLECEYLSTANLMSINAVKSVSTGYSPENGNARNAYLDPEIIIKDLKAFSSSDPAQIYYSPTKYASGSYVSQFIQVNFDNGEKALVQFDAKSWNGSPDVHYCSVQCGNSKAVSGEKYWTCDGNDSTDDPPLGAGDSIQGLTSASLEKTVNIRIDGGGTSNDGVYFHYYPQ